MNGIVEQEKDAKLHGITESICCEVQRYQNKVRVDIRKWWFDPKTGMYARGRNGLNLTLEEYQTLFAAMGEVNAFVQKAAQEV